MVSKKNSTQPQNIVPMFTTSSPARKKKTKQASNLQRYFVVPIHSPMRPMVMGQLGRSPRYKQVLVHFCLQTVNGQEGVDEISEIIQYDQIISMRCKGAFFQKYIFLLLCFNEQAFIIGTQKKSKPRLNLFIDYYSDIQTNI